MVPLFASVFSLALGPAQAATLTYAVGGSSDGRVVVGFFNDASGHTTSDLLTDVAARSRNDTLWGPLPPVGLPSYDAEAYSAVELGTNLNAAAGPSPRTVFSPFNPTFFRAAGQTLAATGSYSAHAFSHSGTAAASTATAWTIRIDPEAGENIGDAVTVTIDADIAGTLSVAGTSTADANWSVVSTAAGGAVIGSSASLTTAGTSAFGETGSLSFHTTIGSTLDLLVDYDMQADGSGAGASSEASVTQAIVAVSVVPRVILPPPIHIRCVAIPDADLTQKVWLDGGDAFDVDDPKGVEAARRVRVLSDESTTAEGGDAADISVEKDGSVWLAPEADEKGDGRAYLLLVEAEDADGEVVRGACTGGTVSVDGTDAGREAVLDEARALLEELEAELLDVGDIDAVDAKSLGLYDLSAGE